MGYAFLPITSPDASDLKGAPGVIENRHYRVAVDPVGGGLLEFFDKDLGHDFAAAYEGWRPGQYIYEEVGSEEGRLAINNYDFSHPDFFIGIKDTPWRRSVASRVTVGEPTIDEARASITVTIEAPGVHGATVTYSLDAATRALHVDWQLDKTRNDDPEAVFIAFPFNLDGADFTIDLNGIPAKPNRDQIDGAAKDWYPLQRWVDVSDAKRGVTVVPLDAPLVHLGGITTGKWTRTLEPEGPTIMSWALNNHWMVNFKASQPGIIPLRYRLTTHDGALDANAAARFAAEVSVPPVVLRDIAPTGALKDSFFAADPEAPVLVTAKPSENDGWIALRLQNLAAGKTRSLVTFATPPSEARASDPIEHPGDALALDGARLAVDLDPRAVTTVLVKFAP